MQKLLTVLALALPAMAQNQLLPPANKPIAELAAVTTAPPANSLLRDVDRAAVTGRSLYGWSAAALVSSNVADLASSWRQQEANPVVAGRGAQFGVGSLAIKSGLVGTTLVLEYITLRHRPDLYKRLAWVNFGASGALGAVAAHNMSVR